MINRGRVLLALALVVVVAVAWTGWTLWQVRGDLDRAQAAVDDLRTAVTDRDSAAQQRAAEELSDAAADVEDATDGWWWGSLSHLPVIGDDLGGVAAIGSSLSTASSRGVVPLTQVVGELDVVVNGGRIDLAVVRGLEQPVTQGAAAFDDASGQLRDIDSSGFVGALSTRFDDYRDQVDEAADALAAARTTTRLLPAMAGGNGPRDYLFIFQNNAEVRATGGLPGSWARIHAEDGRLSLREQGAWGDFPITDDPVVDVSGGERGAFNEGFATSFSSANLTRDFPRAAEVWNGFWTQSYPETPLDGVIALDPVALSYLLAGTGPVEVGDVVLDADSVVDQVLNESYVRLSDPADQDAFFQEVARSVFEALTGDLTSPVEFVSGLARASREQRFLVAPFAEAEAQEIDGTAVEGALTGPDPTVPYVDAGLNDATGAKMSYYLRYDAEVEAVACRDDVQQLAGRLTMRQNIAPSEAVELPDYITGGGRYGIEPGSQLLSVQLYGPPGGSFGPVQIDGRQIGGLTAVRIDDRPVVRLAVLLDSRADVQVTWSMASAPGQTGDVDLGVTPGVVPGTVGGSSSSACG